MDFGSISSAKSSMRRKQSNSILGTFGRSSSSRASAIPFNTASQPSSSAAQPPPSAYSASYPTPPTSTSSHFPDQSILDFSPEYTDTSSGRTPSTIFSHGHAHGHGHGLGHSASRSISGGTIGAPPSLSTTEKGEKGEKRLLIRRPEDVFHVTRERLFSWSYMMQWYQGDIHWFNTIKVSRQALEASLGPAKVDTRARNLYLLGMSMSPLFDISNASDFVRALLKLLDDWEAAIVEGGKGVKTLFNKRSQKKSTSVLPPELSANVSDPDSHLINLTAPFPIDFFQCHATFCSIVRDLYKKFLGMVLPRDPAVGGQLHSASAPPGADTTNPTSLIHASTVIQSAPVDASTNPLSPISTFSGSDTRHGGQVSGGTVEAVQDPMELKPRARVEQYDAFQALVAGQLPADRMLVGDGQKLTPGLVEMFIKADARLKKHFSTLIREGDALAKKVLEDEFNRLATSLHTGSPLDFDIQNAYSVGGSHGQGPVTATGSTFRDYEG